MFRSGDTRNAIPVIDSLIRDVPKDPYFWELKGQALLEGGQPGRSCRAAQAGRSSSCPITASSNHAGAGAGRHGEPANARAALSRLRSAQQDRADTSSLHQFMAMAYGQLGDIPLAELATAEAAFYRGDKKLAEQKAKVAMATLKRGLARLVES